MLVRPCRGALAAMGTGDYGYGLASFLVLYFAFMVFVVVSVLCGESESLERTVFGTCHRFLLGGWYDCVVACTRRLLGNQCGKTLVVSH